jgi:hypothetical protein
VGKVGLFVTVTRVRVCQGWLWLLLSENTACFELFRLAVLCQQQQQAWQCCMCVYAHNGLPCAGDYIKHGLLLQHA